MLIDRNGWGAFKCDLILRTVVWFGTGTRYIDPNHTSYQTLESYREATLTLHANNHAWSARTVTCPTATELAMPPWLASSCSQLRVCIERHPDCTKTLAGAAG